MYSIDVIRRIAFLIFYTLDLNYYVVSLFCCYIKLKALWNEYVKRATNNRKRQRRRRGRGRTRRRRRRGRKRRRRWTLCECMRMYYTTHTHTVTERRSMYEHTTQFYTYTYTQITDQLKWRWEGKMYIKFYFRIEINGEHSLLCLLPHKVVIIHI